MSVHEPSPPRHVDKSALVIGAALLALAALIAWDASRLTGAVSMYSGISAASVPYGIAVCLAVLGIATAASGFFADSPQEREPIELPSVAWICGGLLAQILLLDVAVFSIATGVLFALTAKGFGRGPLWGTIPAGIAFSFVLYLIFSRGLELSMPAGFLERLI